MDERSNGHRSRHASRNHSSSHGSVHSSFKDWLQLFRLPNLLTVPGDPIAGAILASAGQGITVERVFLVAVASVGLYAAGLLMNLSLIHI